VASWAETGESAATSRAQVDNWYFMIPRIRLSNRELK
jgi:hypothetical protein